MSFSERIDKFYKKNISASECVALSGCLCNWLIDVEKASSSIIKMWVKSPKHNHILIDAKSKYGAVSCESINSMGGFSTFDCAD